MDEKYSVRKIAALFGRSPCKAAQELQRGITLLTGTYFAESPERMLQQRKKDNPIFQDYVTQAFPCGGMAVTE